MMSAASRQLDKNRLTADLSAAAVELLSAQCAADRVRLQYSAQDIVRFGEPQTLRRAITSAEALHRFFSQVAAHLPREDSGSRGSR
jgi:hypothetical protein